MDILIKWLSDDFDCDTCGCIYADGAVVFINGEEALDLAPVAACFGGTNYTAEDVYKAILSHIGCNVAEEYS